MTDGPWIEWYQSLAKPSWTLAPRTIGNRRHRMPESRPGRYRRYQGNEYTVIGVARHSETLE